MLKKNCPNCQASLTLTTVMLAVNPARIPCRQCKQAIKIHASHTIAALIITAFVSIGLLFFMDANGAPNLLLWPALLVAGGLLEMLYFYLINKGAIKSNLTDAPYSQPQNTPQ